MSRRRADLRAAAARWAPPPEYLLGHVVTRVPLVGPRMRLYELAGASLEDRSTTVVMLGAQIAAPRRVSLGAGTVIGPGVVLDARGGIRIGRSVNVSGWARFMTAKHGVDDPDFGAILEPIELGDRVWIGIGATILGGVTVGEGAVVAAGAVVTKDVAPFTIVAGVPARPVRSRNPELRYELGYRPNWR